MSPAKASRSGLAYIGGTTVTNHQLTRSRQHVAELAVTSLLTVRRNCPCGDCRHSVGRCESPEGPARTHEIRSIAVRRGAHGFKPGLNVESRYDLLSWQGVLAFSELQPLSTELGTKMTQCRKCGLPIRFERRVFGGVLKWYPTNPDGSEHWDNCKKVTRNDYANMGPAAAQRKADSICPPFWTLAKPTGGYRVTYAKPEGWDAGNQNVSAEDLF